MEHESLEANYGYKARLFDGLDFGCVNFAFGVIPYINIVVI